MKQKLCIFLSLLLCLNVSMVSIATSTNSDVISYDENKTVETKESEETKKITNEIMLMNFIGVRLEEIIRTESTVLLKDTIDLIQKGGIKFTTIDKKTQNYLQSLFDSTTDWKLEDMDRNRLLYNYSQRESRAMNAALKPNVMALMTSAVASAATKDPLTAVLSIGSLVADSVSSYYGSLEQSEQEYDDGNFKLDKERLKTIDGIKKNFFDYCNDMVRDNNIPENMIVYQTKAEKYGENLLDKNLVSRLKYFEDNVSLLDGLPSVHLEMAKCYFEKGEYKKCVEEIDKYNESGVNIFNYDENLINTYPLGFAAASKYMSISEYESYVVKNMKYAEELENLLVNGDIKNMLPMFKYKNTLVYMDLYGKTNKKEYLDKAYDKCKTNIIPLVREQRKLEEQDRLAINELLINNLEALKALAEKRGIDNNEKKELNSLVFGNSSIIFYNYPLSEHYYFGDYKNEVYDYMVNFSTEDIYMFLDVEDGKTCYNITIPDSYVTNDAEVSINYKDLNGSTINAELNFLDNSEFYSDYYQLDYDKIVDFNDKTIISVNAKPKRGIECKQLSFDVECAKIPFGEDENGNYTVEEMITSLVDLGFDKENINSKKNKGLIEKDDGKVKKAAYSYYSFVSAADRSVSERVYTWSKGALLSTNQKFIIEYR
ncbi:MAG: hypothetical protein J6M39_02980 [Lachnospiraceae bacterium]|nr:hypothetical protein [Lachnospiraceae bacterium]